MRLACLLLLAACTPTDDDSGKSTDTAVNDTGAGDTADSGDTDTGTDLNPLVQLTITASATELAAGSAVTLTLSGLDDAQAYRFTLVASTNFTATSDGSGYFTDSDANGVVEAGGSDAVALVVGVNDYPVAGTKTVPASTDDPANPSGLFSVGGSITITVVGVAAGTVVPVVYENGGTSTLLEVDPTRKPVEVHGIGPILTVTGSKTPSIAPLSTTTLSSGSTATLTAFGLDDTVPYRVMVVDAAHISATAPSFVVGDGVAKYGSEAVSITGLGSEPLAGVATWPAETDDPAAPTGLFPVGGILVVTVQAGAPGAAYLTVFPNGGSSTLLEVDEAGSPLETVGVSGELVVNN